MKTYSPRIKRIISFALISVLSSTISYSQTAYTSGFSSTLEESYILSYRGQPVHSFYPTDDVYFSLDNFGYFSIYAKRIIRGWRYREILELDVKQASVGKDFVLILKKNGMLYWHAMVHSDQPALVDWVGLGQPQLIASNVESISAGNDHYVFVYENGVLMGGGYDAGDGRFGGNQERSISTPVQLASGVLSASAGQGFTLFIKTDGSLWAMGANEYGNLGTGDSNPVYTPRKVAAGVVKVQAERDSSWYVTTEGSLYVMGGKFGVVPTKISIAQDVKQAAISHSKGSVLWVEYDGELYFGHPASGEGGAAFYASGGIRGDFVSALNQGFLTVKKGVPLFRFVSPGGMGEQGNPFKWSAPGTRFMSILPEEIAVADQFLDWNGLNHYVQDGPIEGAKPVYRYFHKTHLTHFYTRFESEIASLENSDQWQKDGIAFYGWDYPVAGSEPVHRFFSPVTVSHYYTIGDTEKEQLIENPTDLQFQYEGIAYWAYSYFGPQ